MYAIEHFISIFLLWGFLGAILIQFMDIDHTIEDGGNLKKLNRLILCATTHQECEQMHRGFMHNPKNFKIVVIFTCFMIGVSIGYGIHLYLDEILIITPT